MLQGEPMLELEPGTPILYLEVNIGNDKDSGKLLLFDGDSPEEVVQVFA
jgi:hypothetical protein